MPHPCSRTASPAPPAAPRVPAQSGLSRRPAHGTALAPRRPRRASPASRWTRLAERSLVPQKPALYAPVAQGRPATRLWATAAAAVPGRLTPARGARPKHSRCFCLDAHESMPSWAILLCMTTALRRRCEVVTLPSRARLGWNPRKRSRSCAPAKHHAAGRQSCASKLHIGLCSVDVPIRSKAVRQREPNRKKKPKRYTRTVAGPAQRRKGCLQSRRCHVNDAPRFMECATRCVKRGPPRHTSRSIEIALLGLYGSQGPATPFGLVHPRICYSRSTLDQSYGHAQRVPAP